ncbi:MAG: hypothetical protein K2Q10_02185, partial [Rhodospirillales bacterium]|nr:hypothetical protein [Rhodospirillales bacterium]
MSNKLWRNLRDRLSAPLTAVAGLFEDDNKEAPPQRREGGERRREEPSYAELDISLHLEQLLHEEGGRFNSKLYV